VEPGVERDASGACQLTGGWGRMEIGGTERGIQVKAITRVAAVTALVVAIEAPIAFAQDKPPRFYPPYESVTTGIAYVFNTSARGAAIGDALPSQAMLSKIVVMRREATPLPGGAAGIRVNYTRSCETGELAQTVEVFDVAGTPAHGDVAETVSANIGFLANLTSSDISSLARACEPPLPMMSVRAPPLSPVYALLKPSRNLKEGEIRVPVVYSPADAVRWSKYRDAALERALDTSTGRYVVARYLDTTSVVDLTHRELVEDMTRMVVYASTEVKSYTTGAPYAPSFTRYSALVSCERQTALVEDSATLAASGKVTSLSLLGTSEYPLGGAFRGKAFAHICELDPSGKGQRVFDNLPAALAEAKRVASTPQ